MSFETDAMRARHLASVVPEVNSDGVALYFSSSILASLTGRCVVTSCTTVSIKVDGWVVVPWFSGQELSGKGVGNRDALARSVHYFDVILLELKQHPL